MRRRHPEYIKQPTINPPPSNDERECTFEHLILASALHKFEAAMKDYERKLLETERQLRIDMESKIANEIAERQVYFVI